MDRTRAIFDWIYNLDEIDPKSDLQQRPHHRNGNPNQLSSILEKSSKTTTPTTTSNLQRHHLYYLSSPDTGLTNEALHARAKKEESGLQQVHEYSKKYKTLLDVWSFLTHHHGLYTAEQLVDRARGDQTKDNPAGAVNQLIKKSYGA